MHRAGAGILHGAAIEGAGAGKGEFADFQRQAVEILGDRAQPVGDAVDRSDLNRSPAGFRQPGHAHQRLAHAAPGTVAVDLVEECLIAEATGIVLRSGRAGQRPFRIGQRHLVEDRGGAQLLVETLASTAIGNGKARPVPEHEMGAVMPGKHRRIGSNQRIERGGLCQNRSGSQKRGDERQPTRLHGDLPDIRKSASPIIWNSGTACHEPAQRRGRTLSGGRVFSCFRPRLS